MSRTLNMTPITIPPKRAYRRAEFVGRRKELAEVARRVTQGKRGEDIDLPVLNFWGIQGCGKSWLMRHLARLYRGPGRLRDGEHKRTCTALLNLVDFDSFEWTAPNLAALLRPAMEDIIKQVGGAAAAATNLLTLAEAAAAGQETAEDLAQAFVDWIIGLTKQFVPLILLDTIERATAEALSQIELHLLEPLASTDRVILITAGRREVARWRRFAVRRRQARPMELAAFTPRDTARQVQKQGFELPGALVYSYSFGLAYASQVVAVAISELSNGRKVDEHFLRENEHRLGQWLAALDNQLLQAIPTDLQQVLRVLCVLRAIRQGALRYLLPPRSDGEYRSLLDDLEATRLVWWDPDRGTYLMAPSLRRLLNLRLRLQEPDVFAQRHGRAADYYRQAIIAHPYDCGPLLIETLYHTAYGYAAQLPDKVNELLAQALEPDKFTVGGADFLLERLRKDDELREALSAPVADQVIQSVQELRRNVRRMRLSAG